MNCNPVSIPETFSRSDQLHRRGLRTATDRGVVVVCDSRVVDKPYGRAFLKACGGARLSRNMADIGSFLDEPDKWRKDKPKTKKAAQKEPVRISRGLRAR